MTTKPTAAKAAPKRMGRPPVPDELKSDRKARSVRLSEAAWSKLKQLGSEWLEQQIARAKLP